MPSVDDIDFELRGFSDNWKNLHDEAMKLLDQRGFIPTTLDTDVPSATTTISRSIVSDDEDSPTPTQPVVAAKRGGRGRGRGRGSRGKATVAASAAPAPKQEISSFFRTNVGAASNSTTTRGKTAANKSTLDVSIVSIDTTIFK